ncbi:MAG: T9SS type A sorting domain-containing protein [Ignavibacteria bacterium]|jgi:hypothetical protein
MWVVILSILFLFSFESFSQQNINRPDNGKEIFIFDPGNDSESFQSSFLQVSDDQITVGDTIDAAITNFDALFLFLGNSYELSQEEGNVIMNYLDQGKPVYLYSNVPAQRIDLVAFWNYIGITSAGWLSTLTTIDRVAGIDTLFTANVLIDTSFIAGSIPAVSGDVIPVLTGISDTSISITTTYIPADTSLQVIIDLFNLVYHPEFLEKITEHFGLNNPSLIQFYPFIDTVWIAGGCFPPDIIVSDLISTSIRDSITIEPSPNSWFFYYDSFGNQIPVDNYYFIVIDSLDQFDYELWYQPKSFPPFEAIQMFFDSTFYIYQNEFDIQLLVKKDTLLIDFISQSFKVEWGLDVEDDEKTPDEFSLYQNYPNPFNPKTKIRFFIPSNVKGEMSNVILKVYDVLGGEITTLVNEEKSVGEYEVEFDGTELPSGIYFYQLSAGSFVQTKKMVFIK